MIWTRPQFWVESHWRPEFPTAVISITDPTAPFAEIPDSDNIIDVLRLQFDDVNEDVGNLVAMTGEQASEVVKFVTKFDYDKCCMLVHCTAGVSRSPGIAAAISRYWYGCANYFWVNYVPNLTCYKLTSEAFDKLGDNVEIP